VTIRAIDLFRSSCCNTPLEVQKLIRTGDFRASRYIDKYVFASTSSNQTGDDARKGIIDVVPIDAIAG
jgi:hypothetical protein